MTDDKHALAMDIECYQNFFLVCFKSLRTGVVKAFSNPTTTQMGQIRKLLADFRIVTFNGAAYDIPMVTYALEGADLAALKSASDYIISGGKPWQFYREFGVSPLTVDHIDLIEVAPGDGSLKLYGARLHSHKLQDLPIPPDSLITPEQARELTRYCENDLDTTIDLYRALQNKIDLRAAMSEQYGIDLRSKSDAQIAETVISRNVAKLTGSKPTRPNILPGTVYRFAPPAFLQFKTAPLQRVLAEVVESEFAIDAKGSPIAPPSLEGRTIRLGSTDYQMGIGGVHSCEKKTMHIASDGYTLMDVDVASFYPSIILQCGLYPEHMGHAFLTVYRDIFDTRIAAKKSGDITTNEVLKIVLNGTYGKLGSKYSALYAPNLMLQVTLTGQLSLLMLIEALELDGISVVSANTDGIVLRFPTNRISDVRDHIARWEHLTGFAMEETHYLAMFSRDVNNYIAIKTSGAVKGKGAFSESGLSKNPQSAICVTAVKELLSRGTPIAQTIIDCADIRQFLTVRRVTGGAKMGENYIGKVVRWYYGKASAEPMRYVTASKHGAYNKVPDSDGAVPCAELPDTFPHDIDFERYLIDANRILSDLGVIPCFRT